MPRTLRLGMFVASGLLIFAGGVFLIGSREFLFRNTYRLSAEFKNVVGLGSGAEVRVAGIHEGTVRSINLPGRSDQKVRITMDLDKSTRDVIKKDSVAAIEAEGLVGDKYVEISFGSKDAEKVKDGDTIGGEAPVEMGDLLKKTNQILDAAQDAVQNIDQSSGNLTSITAKLNQGTGTMGALLNDKAIYEHVNAGTAAFQDDMEALKHNFLLRGFFKKRGYEDSDELAKHEIAQLPGATPEKQFTFDAANLFDKPDSAKLKNQKTLSEAGKFLEGAPFRLAVVAAYTGMKGDTDKARQLTDARATVVRDYLVQNFRLDDTRIKTLGLGKSRSDEGSGVEIVIYPAVQKPAAATAARRRQ